LAEKILASRIALEGERKQVTVLFADIKGSLEWLADRNPEEARQLLDPVLERMMVAVHRYEGTVNQVLGDGIMALFGAPIAHEDHAVRAAYAALTMQEAIATEADQLRRQHGISLQIRVGLNASEVVVRGIGNDLAMDYTAVEQTTHLAARMEQLASPGTILVTEAFARLTEGYLRFKPLGLLPVKGLPDSVEVFELIGADSAWTRLQAALARGLTPFVGRHAEVQAFHVALERAGSGHGQLVAVIGEPGMGKSRLVYEFITSPPMQDWLILETSAVSYDQATPYLPIHNLLTAYFHIDDRDEEWAIREKVDKRLAPDVALQPTRPAMLALLDVAIDQPEWQALDPPQRRLRIIDGVKRLLLRQSQVQPLVVVVENLHWINTETQALLDSLVESLPGAHLLLVVNYRPEYQHGWGSKSYYTQLRLDPLPPESAAELLRPLLGDDASLTSLKRLLIEWTAGNPFFLEESVRTLVEAQALGGERGAYRLTRALPSLQVPATVEAVLAARIDRLPREEKRLLQTAAVIGTHVPLPLLQAIAELSEEALRRGLTHLQAAEFLHERSLFPELVYTFTHALTQEVASRSLLREQRRVLHARILEANERLAGERLADQVERLALHAFQGEVWAKALEYLRQAGDKAMARPAYRQAVACYEQALEALAHLPAGRQVHEAAIDLRFNLRNVLLPLGEQGRILGHLRQAATLAEARQDPQRLGWVSIYMTSGFYNMAQPDHAVESGERALAMATLLGDVALDIQAAYYLGLAYHLLGNFRQAVDVLSRNVASLDGEMIHERFGLPYLPAVFSGTWLVWLPSRTRRVR
jgi:class 3 adenylate cyclase/tetratricopeptide (TPR) repeat protein